MAEPTGPGPTSPTGPSSSMSEENYIELLLASAKQTEIQNELLAERARLQKMTSEEFRLQLDLQMKTLNAFTSQLPALEDREKLQDAINKHAQEHKEEIDAMIESQQLAAEAAGVAFDVDKERLAIIRSQTEEQHKQIETINDKHGLILKEFETTEDMKDLGKIRVKDGKQTLIQAIKEAKSQKEVKELMLEARGLLSQTNDLRSKLTNHAEKYSKHLGMASNVSETSVGTFIDITKQLGQAGKAGFTMGDMLGKAFGQSFNLLNIFASMVDIIKDMVIQLDGVGKKLGATTGMGNVFQSQIMTTFDATVRGGGTMEESAAAIGSLATSFSKFDPKAKAVNESLATTVVRLGKIGVSGDTAAKTMDFFVRTLRMTEQQSADLTTELALMGQQMGMTATQITSDFQAVSSDLAVYGNNAINVFKDLEAQAKATGMQISALVTMAKQFDTFDKAADKAAQLNSVLGTQLSSLELMNMSYDERISYLRQEVSFSVGNMENLDQYTQQFIAQALGVGSVAEAQKFLNMSQAEYLKYQGDMAKSAKTQEDLAALTEELVPVLQQFKLAFMQIATTLGPVISLLAKIIGFVGQFADIIMLAYAAIKIYNAIMLVHNTVKIAAAVSSNTYLGSLNALFIHTMTKTIPALFQKTLAFIGLGTATGTATTGMTLFGVATNFSLGKIAIFLTIMAALLALFSTRFNPIFVAAFHFMAAGVTILGAAFNTIQGPAMLAMLVFSLMVGMLALFVFSLKELITTLVESGAGLFTAASGMYAIAGGITAIAGAMFMLGPLGVLGLIGLSLSMSALGEGFERTASGIERLSKMGAALSGLGNNGLIAMTSEGNRISAVMGTGDVFQNFSSGKMEVEVKMPEMQTPKFDIKLIVDGKQFNTHIKSVVNGK